MNDDRRTEIANAVATLRDVGDLRATHDIPVFSSQENAIITAIPIVTGRPAADIIFEQFRLMVDAYVDARYARKSKPWKMPEVTSGPVGGRHSAAAHCLRSHILILNGEGSIRLTWVFNSIYEQPNREFVSTFCRMVATADDVIRDATLAVIWDMTDQLAAVAAPKVAA